MIIRVWTGIGLMRAGESYHRSQLRIWHWIWKSMSPVAVLRMSRPPMRANPQPTVCNASSTVPVGRVDRGAQLLCLCSVSQKLEDWDRVCKVEEERVEVVSATKGDPVFPMRADHTGA
jgi:hypothetical protein